MQVMMSGNVPAGAGLSSSSAFVVASFLATAVANDKSFTRTEVLFLNFFAGLIFDRRLPSLAANVSSTWALWVVAWTR